MQQVITWFDCLWAAEELRLSVRQTRDMNAIPAMAASIAPHWRRLRRGGNGQALFVPSNAEQHKSKETSGGPLESL